MNREEEIEKIKNSSVNKNIMIIISIFILSLISVFGIYNTFGIGDIYHMIINIDKDSDRYANITIGVIFGVTMIILQGVNFKRKTIMEKGVFLFGIAILLGIIMTLVFSFTHTIIYPLITMVIIGISIYLFDFVFVTLGVKGFFFFLSIFSLVIIGLLKAGISSTSLIFLVEFLISIILFLSATYPRIKQILFKIGTRDNVDISNTGNNESDSDSDDQD